MLNKEEFIKIINRLKEANDIQDRVNDIFREAEDNILCDFTNAGSLMICHEDIVVELLENIFDTDMISYWIYELDYGRDYIDGCIVDEHNEVVNIETAEDLYDYLIRSM